MADARKPVTDTLFRELATQFGFDPAVLAGFTEVEAGGAGYDAKTGKLLIQFEPLHFRLNLPKAVRAQVNAAVSAVAAGKATPEQATLAANWKITQANGVDSQGPERAAFNAAFAIHPTAAMLGTSYGMTQIMGFNHALCGYATVDDMVDAFRLQGEAEHVRAMVRFINSKGALRKAVKAKDWKTMAYYYNGERYALNNYHIKLEKAYRKHQARFA